MMADILASELLVTEAMHGTIVADALRVPWVPVRPVQRTNRGKWFDWASALDIELRPQHIVASNLLEYAMSLTACRRANVLGLRKRGQWLRGVGRGVCRRRAAKALLGASKGPLHLSTDSAIERAHTRMLEQLERLRHDFR